MKEHLKNLSKHSFVYTAANMLTKAVGIFLIPVYVRYLTQEEYGIISLLAPVGTVLLTLFDFGQKATFTRFFFDYPDKSDEQKELLGNIVIVNLFLMLLGCAVLFVWGQSLFDKFIGNVAFYPFIVLTIGTSVTQVLFELKLSVFRSRNQSWQYGMYSFTRFLFIVLLTIIMVVIYKMGAKGKLLSEFLVTLFYMVITLYLLLKDIKFNINFDIIKSVFHYSMPLMPHIISGVLMGLVAKYFINLYHGLALTGIYNIAFLLSSVMSIIVLSINQVWSPVFFKMAHENEPEANRVFVRLTTYYYCFVGFFGLMIIFFSKEFVMLFATKEYMSSIDVMPALTMSAFFNGLYFTVSSKVYFVKSAIRLLPIASIIGLVVNILFSWLLVPSMGMAGAAWATLGANFAIFAITYYLSQKYFYMPYEFWRIGKASLAIVFVFVGYIFAYKFISSVYILIAVKLLLGIFYFIMLYLFNFLNRDEINWLVKIFKSIKLKT
jgi:O-antigen/teichoic acid export membrane protein